MKKYILISTAIIPLLNISCNSENSQQQKEKGYFISLTGSSNIEDSRAHWEENNNNALEFHWDSYDTEMKAFVFREGSNLSFINGKHYSGISITPDKSIRLKANLDITDGLEVEYMNGDIIWSISPAPEQNITDNSVAFTLPDEYVMGNNQNSPTEHLKHYVLMSGAGTVTDGKSNIDFNIYPTIFRFKLINRDSEVLKIYSASFSGPFNHKAEVNYSKEGNIRISYSRNDKPYSIKVKSEEGFSINPGESTFLYGLALPTVLADDVVSLYIESNFGVLSGDAVYNKLFKDDDGFAENTYKTLSVPLNRSEIEFDEVTIENFLPGGEFEIPFDE